jgi:hypothetical protein
MREVSSLQSAGVLDFDTGGGAVQQRCVGEENQSMMEYRCHYNEIVISIYLDSIMQKSYTSRKKLQDSIFLTYSAMCIVDQK